MVVSYFKAPILCLMTGFPVIMHVTATAFINLCWSFAGIISLHYKYCFHCGRAYFKYLRHALLKFHFKLNGMLFYELSTRYKEQFHANHFQRKRAACNPKNILPKTFIKEDAASCDFQDEQLMWLIRNRTILR
jgi:hypothetical protein